MINLLYPRDTDRSIFSLDGWLIGPIGLDANSPLERLNYRSAEDKLDEFGISLHHEKSVAHIHNEGDLIYDPIRDKIADFHTSVYPQQVRLTYLPGLYKDYCYGRPDSGLSSLNNYSYPYGQNRFCHRVSSTQWEEYLLTFIAPNKVYTLTKSTWSMTKVVGVNMYFTKVRSYYDIMGSPVVEDLVWTIQQDITAFEKAWNYVAAHHFAPLRVTTSTVSFALTTAIFDYDLISPASVFRLVDTKVRSLAPKEDFSLPGEKPFGDLVMEATENLNANNVNMIAFLRDFRHPLDMIPKLKNLRSLKGLAGNFLAVNYGILPTVSDLRNIVESFKRLKPSLDRNGFRTCYAGCTNMASTSLSTITVVQRAKIGIAKEDDGLEALEEGLENIGFLPTFENLWDLVPYSFVLDWFISVGDLLERIDTRVRLLRLNIRYVTLSRKVVVDSTISSGAVPHTYGHVQRVQYHRWVNDHAPVPPLSLQSSLADFDHWLESAALILQRIK